MHDFSGKAAHELLRASLERGYFRHVPERSIPLSVAAARLLRSSVTGRQVLEGEDQETIDTLDIQKTSVEGCSSDDPLDNRREIPPVVDVFSSLTALEEQLRDARSSLSKHTIGSFTGLLDDSATALESEGSWMCRRHGTHVAPVHGVSEFASCAAEIPGTRFALVQYFPVAGSFESESGVGQTRTSDEFLWAFREAARDGLKRFVLDGRLISIPASSDGERVQEAENGSNEFESSLLSGVRTFGIVTRTLSHSTVLIPEKMEQEIRDFLFDAESGAGLLRHHPSHTDGVDEASYANAHSNPRADLKSYMQGIPALAGFSEASGSESSDARKGHPIFQLRGLLPLVPHLFCHECRKEQQGLLEKFGAKHAQVVEEEVSLLFRGMGPAVYERELRGFTRSTLAAASMGELAGLLTRDQGTGPHSGQPYEVTDNSLNHALFESPGFALLADVPASCSLHELTKAELTAAYLLLLARSKVRGTLLIFRDSWTIDGDSSSSADSRWEECARALGQVLQDLGNTILYETSSNELVRFDVESMPSSVPWSTRIIQDESRIGSLLSPESVGLLTITEASAGRSLLTWRASHQAQEERFPREQFSVSDDKTISFYVRSFESTLRLHLLKPEKIRKGSLGTQPHGAPQSYEIQTSVDLEGATSVGELLGLNIEEIFASVLAARAAGYAAADFLSRTGGKLQCQNCRGVGCESKKLPLCYAAMQSCAVCGGTGVDVPAEHNIRYMGFSFTEIHATPLAKLEQELAGKERIAFCGAVARHIGLGELTPATKLFELTYAEQILTLALAAYVNTSFVFQRVNKKSPRGLSRIHFIAPITSGLLRRLEPLNVSSLFSQLPEEFRQNPKRTSPMSIGLSPAVYRASSPKQNSPRKKDVF